MRCFTPNRLALLLMMIIQNSEREKSTLSPPQNTYWRGINFKWKCKQNFKQILYFCITEGQAKHRAILSLLFKNEPGAHNVFFDKLSNISLPNPTHLEEALEYKSSTLNLEDVLAVSSPNSQPYFSYFSYEGSQSHPPCAGNRLKQDFINILYIKPFSL